jgi:hypothetical protein
LAQPSADYLPLDNPSVHLTALYTHAGCGYLRLYNGSDAEQAVSLPGSLTLTDLHHRELGQFRNPLRPWQIATLRLW